MIVSIPINRSARLYGETWNFDYTGSEQLFTVPCKGVYKLETWGAQGGGTSLLPTSGGGGGFYGGGSSNHVQGSGGGSGYIGNNLLNDKTMYCYECEESDDISTKTISTTCINNTPTSNCAKEGNGFARITLVAISN